MCNQKPVESMAEILEMIIIWRTPESRWFGKIIVELPPHTCTEIAVKFPVNYKPALQQMENLIKSNLQTITSAPGNPPKKLTFARFFKRIYKIYIVTIFPTLVALILQHPFLDLTWGQFLGEEYQFNKNNPYVKKLPLLISTSPKLKSIFSIVVALGTMQYEFEYRAMTEVPEKLVIVATNPLVCYLIVKVDYAKPFLVSKLIVLNIKFEVPGEANFVNDILAKPERLTRPSQHIPKLSKNLVFYTSENHYRNNETYENWYKFNMGTTNYYRRSKIYLICQTISGKKDYKNRPNKSYHYIHSHLIQRRNQKKNKVL